MLSFSQFNLQPDSCKPQVLRNSTNLIRQIASNCVIFASNILVAADRTAREWEERGIAIAVIAFVTLVHMLIPTWGVRLMNALGSLKVLVLLFVVVTGWVVLSGKVDKIPDPHASFRNSFAGSSHSGYEYATALYKVLNSYEGYVMLASSSRKKPS